VPLTLYSCRILGSVHCQDLVSAMLWDLYGTQYRTPYAFMPIRVAIANTRRPHVVHPSSQSQTRQLQLLQSDQLAHPTLINFRTPPWPGWQYLSIRMSNNQHSTTESSLYSGPSFDDCVNSGEGLLQWILSPLSNTLYICAEQEQLPLTALTYRV